MKSIINPYMRLSATGATYPNQYSMDFVRVDDGPSVERLYINNKSNAIDTTLRDSTPNFTVTGWFKVDDAASGATERAIFSKYENYQGRDRNFTIGLAGTSFYILGYWDSITPVISVYKITTQTFTSADGWVHFAFTYDYTQTSADTIARLYINGIQITAFTTNTVSTTNKYFYNQVGETNRGYVSVGCYYAGASANNPSFGWGGNIDEITFWDKTLSSTEITELYNAGDAYDISLMTSYSTNCLAWWRMGDYSGDVWSAGWTIANVKGTANTDLISANLIEADRVTDAP
jgi:hypothetical protein